MPGKRILIIEDDLDDQFLLSEAFQNSHYRCELDFAGDGRQALVKMDQSGYWPDLIILDLNMPIMNGFEVLSHFQAAKSMARVPVIVLTTAADSNSIERSYDLGATSFIVKPKTFSQLESIVDELTRYWFMTVRLSSLPG